MKRILTILLLFATLYVNAGEIVVRKGESIHDALRQAREWRRTNDPRCQDGITIIIEEGRYYMNEPLFLRVAAHHPRYWREAHKCHLWRPSPKAQADMAVKRTR